MYMEMCTQVTDLSLLLFANLYIFDVLIIIW